MQNEKYDYDYLNELCDQIDLLEYAQQMCDFHRRGDKYFCSCPKHSDSDPSLCISPDVNLFYCFSCGRNGNLINWMMEYEGLSFHQAVEKVAKLTGTELKSYVESNNVKLFKLLNRISKQNNKIQIERTILDPENDYHQKYLDEVPQEWVDEGISPEEMKKYEIRIDPSSNRIVYPVYSNEDELIGVKGRTRFKNYKDLNIIKYINYYKLGGRLDYFQGMRQARPFIQSQNEIIIFEGLKSVMKVDQWGYHNAVSAETSTLNDLQIELLIKMQVKNVVIAFDKDVKFKKIIDNVEFLKKFTNVYVVYDKWGLLDEKDSPPDKGKEVWETLYERRVRA